MNVWVTRMFSYLVSLTFVTIVLIYGLYLPTFMSGAPLLVKEYYYVNAISSFLLDIILVATYISMGMVSAKILNVRADDHGSQLGVQALTAGLISSLFMIFFLGQSNNSFFTRWFKAAGFRAVLYDMILVCSVYFVMIQVHNRIFPE